MPPFVTRRPTRSALCRCLEHLEELNLFQNNLVALPPRFASLAKLEKLRLSSNRLSRIPKELGGMSCEC